MKEIIRNYILQEFYKAEDTEKLKDDTPLISSRVIDSISALQMVEFLEKEFNFEFQAHEVDQEHLDT
ncbi:MAG: acyl carrier protein, partial [Methyloprofundus sp.]|nr:acyl carrier protein [Methyloprofundus sp.]